MGGNFLYGLFWKHQARYPTLAGRGATLSSEKKGEERLDTLVHTHRGNCSASGEGDVRCSRDTIAAAMRQKPGCKEVAGRQSQTIGDAVADGGPGVGVSKLHSPPPNRWRAHPLPQGEAVVGGTADP